METIDMQCKSISQIVKVPLKQIEVFALCRKLFGCLCGRTYIEVLVQIWLESMKK